MRREIDTWRDTLTLTDRVALNHPNAVLRRFKAAMTPPSSTEPAPRQKMSERVAELEEENQRLKMSGGEGWAAHDGTDDIAPALFAEFLGAGKIDKAERVANKLIELVQERRAGKAA